MITDTLSAVRDRLSAAFSSSISELEQDPHAAPDPRDEQLQKLREEVAELVEELEASQEALREEMERFGMQVRRDEDDKDAS